MRVFANAEGILLDIIDDLSQLIFRANLRHLLNKVVAEAVVHEGPAGVLFVFSIFDNCPLKNHVESFHVFILFGFDEISLNESATTLIFSQLRGIHP